MKTLNAGDNLAFLTQKILGLKVKNKRLLIALAGPPASGKSTLARALVDALNENGPVAVLMPMDGFHLDDAILTKMGLLARKGSPETFDSHGFVNAVVRLNAEDSVYLPVFDRERELSVAGAVAVRQEHKIVIVEGNYLCFDEHPWRSLIDHWDLSVYLDVAPEVLTERLVQRWLDLGISRSVALEKADFNDLPNAERVRTARSRVDVLIS